MTIKLQRNISLAASILIYSTLVFYNENNWFWLIDDHEIFALIGVEGQCAIDRITRMLASVDEINTIGNRFRPIYYLFRVIETATWCDNYKYWLLFRIFLFATSIYLVATQFLKYGLPLAIFASFMIISMPFFADIVPRLGPQELYGVFFLSIYLNIYLKMVRRERLNKYLWATWTLASMLLMGVKEPFIQIFPISLVVLYCYSKSNPSEKINILKSLIFQFIAFLLLAARIIYPFLDNNFDSYGNSVNLIVRMQASFAILPSPIGYVFLLLGSIFLINISRVYYGKSVIIKYACGHLEFMNLMMPILLAGLLVANIFIYNGALSHTNRYAFPSLYFVAIYLLHYLLTHLEALSKGWGQFGKSISLIFYALLVIGAIYQIRSTVIYLNGIANKKLEINKQLFHLKNNTKNYDAIAINYSKNYAYESLYSIRTLFSYYKIDKVIFLTYHGNSEVPDDLREQSEKGLPSVRNYNAILPKIEAGGMDRCSGSRCLIFEMSGGW